MQSEILGAVSSVHTFNGMCDYQLLPVLKQAGIDGVGPNSFENLTPKLIPQDIPSALSWWDGAGIYKGRSGTFGVI